MKNDYLNELKELLKRHQVSEKDIEDIMSDYEQMYSDGLDKDLSDKEIRDMLGEPKKIYEDLKDTLTFIVQKHRDHKLVALSPFIAVITFMSIGMSTNIWHPTWLVFLLIPILGVLSGRKNKDQFIGVMPFISLITFILGTYFFGYYEYFWLIFLIIPISALLFYPNKGNKVMLTSLVAAIIFYVYMTYNNYDAWIASLGFILPVCVSIYYGKIKIFADFDRSRKSLILLSILIVLIGLFFVIGFTLPNGFVYSWQVFLLFPISAIILSGRFRFVAIMPFLATIIFFSVGYFFNLFNISWLAFLLIPITGILDDKKK